VPPVEISDLITRHDPVTGANTPVPRSDVIDALMAAGDRRGARIVASLPHRSGFLDPDAVDSLLIRTHTELQRLNEELRIAAQMVALLKPLLKVATRPGERARVVDVGCGIGYVIRWLAATGTLDDVELCGVDFNAALIGEASRLASGERLNCRFVHGDAFGLPEAATVYISTGVLHHVSAAELAAFFVTQERAGAQAYCHFDIASTQLAPIGAWIFHRARMREPLGRHDGVVSARRAHDDHTLMTAASAARGLTPLLYRPVEHTNPFCASVRPILGVGDRHLPALREALGPHARHLVSATIPRARRPW
jgi:SAM-dependent methyltransferase